MDRPTGFTVTPRLHWTVTLNDFTASSSFLFCFFYISERIASVQVCCAVHSVDQKKNRKVSIFLGFVFAPVLLFISPAWPRPAGEFRARGQTDDVYRLLQSSVFCCRMKSWRRDVRAGRRWWLDGYISVWVWRGGGVRKSLEKDGKPVVSRAGERPGRAEPSRAGPGTPSQRKRTCFFSTDLQLLLLTEKKKKEKGTTSLNPSMYSILHSTGVCVQCQSDFSGLKSKTHWNLSSGEWSHAKDGVFFFFNGCDVFNKRWMSLSKKINLLVVWHLMSLEVNLQQFCTSTERELLLHLLHLLPPPLLFLPLLTCIATASWKKRRRADCTLEFLRDHRVPAAPLGVFWTVTQRSSCPRRASLVLASPRRGDYIMTKFPHHMHNKPFRVSYQPSPPQKSPLLTTAPKV